MRGWSITTKVIVPIIPNLPIGWDDVIFRGAKGAYRSLTCLNVTYSAVVKFSRSFI